MKRDWECVREILTRLEQQPAGPAVLKATDVQGWDEPTVHEHMRLLSEHGLIDARCRDMNDGSVFCVGLRLTWEGHELLKRIGAPRVWGRIRHLANDHGLDLSLEIIAKLAARVLGEMIDK